MVQVIARAMEQAWPLVVLRVPWNWEGEATAAPDFWHRRAAQRELRPPENRGARSVEFPDNFTCLRLAMTTRPQSNSNPRTIQKGQFVRSD